MRLVISSRSRLFSDRVIFFFFFFWGGGGCHLCVVFFLLSYFADVFKSSMWTNFREAVPQNDVALSSLA